MFTRVGDNIEFLDNMGVRRDYTTYKNIPSWLPSLIMSPKLQYETADPPDTYKGQLQPHQKVALGFALSRPRSMLALDCGLGKTHIGMAYMLMHLPALVICPASLKTSWLEHLYMFAPDSMHEIEIVSYSSLKKLKQPMKVNCIVVDEAHYLKHESSIRSKLFHKLQETCKNILLLTGTPAQRNMDLFNLLKILDGDRFKYFWHYNHSKKPNELYFADRYCMPEPIWIGGCRHGYKFTKNNNCKELALICEIYILRMKKQDILKDLPPLETISEIVGSTSSPEYFKTKLSDIEHIRETRGNRMADKDLLALCRESTTQKLPFVKLPIQTWLQENVDSKCILFYHHSEIGDQLVDMVHDMGVSHIRIDGKMSMKKRCEQLTTFHQDRECRVGILSLCATSTGLNLQFCTKIFFVEMTFLSVHHTQAESRIHRIGQTQNVSVTYLLLHGTTDMMLWNSFKSKRQTERLLFDDDEHSSDDGNVVVVL